MSFDADASIQFSGWLAHSHVSIFIIPSMCTCARQAHMYTSRRAPRAPCEAKSGSVKRAFFLYREDQCPGRQRRWTWKTASLCKTPEWIEWASCEGVERKQMRRKVYPAGGSTFQRWNFQQYVVMVDRVNLYERVNLCVYVCVRREDIVFMYSCFWVFPLSPFEKLSSFTYFEDNLPFLFALCYFSWTLHERVSNLKFEPIFRKRRCDCMK